jgi:hypothetical protein
VQPHRPAISPFTSACRGAPRPAASRYDDGIPERHPGPPAEVAGPPAVVSLSQIAQAAGRSHRTLESYLHQRRGGRRGPEPVGRGYNPGGHGRPLLWATEAIRPWLLQVFGRCEFAGGLAPCAVRYEPVARTRLTWAASRMPRRTRRRKVRPI